jgi:hypothetical protein
VPVKFSEGNLDEVVERLEEIYAARKEINLDDVLEKLNTLTEIVEEMQYNETPYTPAEAQGHLLQEVYIDASGRNGGLAIDVWFGEFIEEIPAMVLPFSEWAENIAENWENSPEALALIDKAIADLQAARDNIAAKEEESDEDDEPTLP